MDHWRINQASAAYLVSLDIVGFTSGEQYPLKYVEARTQLEQAVFNTPLVERCLTARTTYLQFLGDELRFAFVANACTPDEIMDCLDGIFDSLSSTNTKVRVVVVTGKVTPVFWNKCLVLKGAVAMKAQRWLDNKAVLAPGCVAVDEAFSIELVARRRRTWESISADGEVLMLWRPE